MDAAERAFEMFVDLKVQCIWGISGKTIYCIYNNVNNIWERIESCEKSI